MSHEIRTPMTAILGLADVLLDDREEQRPRHDRREIIKTIKRNGEYLLDLINDILDLSKIEAGKLEVQRKRFQLNRLTTEVMNLMRVRADAKRLKLIALAKSPVPQFIESDEIRTRQILINLIGNAIKFTEAGEIQMVVACRDADSDRPLLQFDIIDTGIGMDESQIRKLFRSFTQVDSSATRKFSGSGLGLAISKRLATMLGGDIQVTSQKKRSSAGGISSATPFALFWVCMRFTDCPETHADYLNRPATARPKLEPARPMCLPTTFVFLPMVLPDFLANVPTPWAASPMGFVSMVISAPSLPPTPKAAPSSPPSFNLPSFIVILTPASAPNPDQASPVAPTPAGPMFVPTFPVARPPVKALHPRPNPLLETPASTPASEPTNVSPVA